MEDAQDWERGSDPLDDYLEAGGFFDSDDGVAYATEQQPLWREPTVSDDGTWEALPPPPQHTMQVGTALSCLLCILFLQTVGFCMLLAFVIDLFLLSCRA